MLQVVKLLFTFNMSTLFKLDQSVKFLFALISEILN